MTDQPPQPPPPPSPYSRPGGTPPPGAAPPATYAPPPQYVQPPKPRGGFFSGLAKVGVAMSVAMFIFFIGFMAGMTALGAAPELFPATYRKGSGGEKILIIPVYGAIYGGTADYVRRVVDYTINDESIKAVVLRVESPGGEAGASDQILHQLSRLRSQRPGIPIIASFGDYAASGGYYVSCQADRIFAEPTTVTGSIGVIASVPTMQDLFENKLGIKFEVITPEGSPEKETGNNIFRNWTDKDRAVIRDLVDAMYEQFVKVVAEGRQKVLSADEVKAIADGSVLTAEEALAGKLVDEIGYLDAALEDARKAGRISASDPPVVYYSQPTGLLDLFGVTAPRSGFDSLIHQPPFGRVNPPANAWQWLTEVSVPRLMYVFQP